MESPTGKGFFAIDRRCWSRACDLGINEAVAYLVLACGTGRNNRETKWSVQSLHRYTGITWERGKAAIRSLINAGLIDRAEGSTTSRPRYTLLPEKGQCDDQELIWLPNSIVIGTSSRELSPVSRLRSASDIWALRLFVDLYHAQNLRDDGGISHRVLREAYDRREIGQSGIYIIWAFRRADRSHWWSGPFAAHRNRAKIEAEGSHPVWKSVDLLEEMGLLAYVPHLLENDSKQAEVIHALGAGGRGEEPIESQIGEAARAAAEKMCADWAIRRAEDEGYDQFCPIVRTLPNIQLVGIPRLRYRPHTRRTGAWYAHLKETGEIAITEYRQLAEMVKTDSEESGGLSVPSWDWLAWGNEEKQK